MASSAEPMEVDDPVSGLSREFREVERQIAVVEGQINAVDGQISAVEVQLEQSNDPKEEKCLVKKEEQLRSLLLKSKEPGKADGTVAHVDSLLDKFWDELPKPNLEYLKPDGFLVDFPVCKVPLPKAPTDECPRLLWHALDQPFEASKHIMDVTSKARPTLTVLFNVSGSGKTRTLYEIAVAQRGLFFVGGVGAEGSGDLKLVVSKLMKLYPTGGIPEVSAAICLKAMLISRFYLLRQLEKMDSTGQAWLFKQVAMPLFEHKDPFMLLTSRLLDLIRTERDLKLVEGNFQGVLDRLRGSWDGPIIFDECQIINTWLEKRFSSPSLGFCTKSFLDILIPALIHSGFRKFYYASTEAMLIRPQDIFRTLGRASVIVFHGFGGFITVKDFKTYAGKLLQSVDGIDMQRVCDLYKGRYRFFVTALEHFIGSKRPLEQATEFLIDFFEKMCTSSTISRSQHGKSKPELYMDKTVLGDVELFFQRPQNVAALKELEVILYHQMFGSMSTLPSLSLVKFGLAWLSSGNSVALEDLDKFSAKQDRDTWIRLEEPAIFRALFHYFWSQPRVFDTTTATAISSHEDPRRASPDHPDKQQFNAKGQGSNVTVGLEFERQVAMGLMVAGALDGKAVPAIYFEVANVVKPRVATKVVTRMCGKRHIHGANCYTLEKYLKSVERQADTFPTVLQTGDGGWGGFPLDALFFLTNNYEGKWQFIPYLLQMKSLNDKATQDKVSNALGNLNFPEWKKKTKDEGLNRLIDFASENGLLQLPVLPYTEQDLGQLGFTSQLSSGGQPQKRQKVEDIQPLCKTVQDIQPLGGAKTCLCI
ncbi:hypothetical protein SELMODRAFT_413907 [Selaginella moellendorffii]|uniref:Uncharacterized protein n=1 Tax=Selaginella moellendorffii TaxID=88036 RepID=D8RR06_SELML|nr:hypothetical protein SELMODRAFT_413907 [Selaginella moellendorffii]